MLKCKSENPDATLLGLFLNAVGEMDPPFDNSASMKTELDRINRFLPIRPDILLGDSKSNAEVLRLTAARSMFRDYDKLFQRYMQQHRFPEISKSAGLEMKHKNSIVQPWPLKLRRNATQHEFDVLHASGHTGVERYVEWRSVV